MHCFGMKSECIPARIYSNARVLPMSCESLAHNVSHMQRAHYDTLNVHVQQHSEKPEGS